MHARDLKIGAIVYHTVFPHWGKGTITKVRNRDLFGYVVTNKYRVLWETGNEYWMRASELRKTFNRKRAEMVAKLNNERNTRRQRKGST